MLEPDKMEKIFTYFSWTFFLMVLALVVVAFFIGLMSG